MQRCDPPGLWTWEVVRFVVESTCQLELQTILFELRFPRSWSFSLPSSEDIHPCLGVAFTLWHLSWNKVVNKSRPTRPHTVANKPRPTVANKSSPHSSFQGQGGKQIVARRVLAQNTVANKSWPTRPVHGTLWRNRSDSSVHATKS